MKESVQKIIDWAKAHPWAAGAIVLVVVLLAWWVSRSTGAGGESAVMIDSGEMADTSQVPGGMGGGSIGGGDSSSPSIPDSSTIPNPNTGSGDLPDLPSSEDVGGDLGLGGLDLGDLTSGIPLPGPWSETASTPTAPNKGGRVPEGGSTGSRVPKTESKRSAAPKDSTPSMLVGKGRHFTGYYNGIWYINGYPSTYSVMGTSTTGGVAAGSSGARRNDKRGS